MEKINLNIGMKSPLLNKTDKQIIGNARKSDHWQAILKGEQPEHLQVFNSPEFRICKLTAEDAIEIRKRYIPSKVGKLLLAKDYGVSKSVIGRILSGKSWKITNKIKN